MSNANPTGVKQGRLEELYLSHAAPSRRIAELLCEDRRQAKPAADRAFIRTVGMFRDLRSPLSFESTLRRAIIRGSRPPLHQRFGGGSNGHRSTDSDDPMWVAYSALPHRKKAALVLRYYERLTDDQVADVLGCSTGAARSLVNKALGDLQTDGSGSADPTQTAGDLVRFFRRSVGSSTTPVEPDRSVVRRATLRRALVLVGVAATVTAAVIAGFAFLG